MASLHVRLLPYVNGNAKMRKRDVPRRTTPPAASVNSGASKGAISINPFDDIPTMSAKASSSYSAASVRLKEKHATVGKGGHATVAKRGLYANINRRKS